MIKTAAAFLLLLASSGASLFAAGPAWDTSGNGLLSGAYYFREVLYVSDSSGNTSRAVSLLGTITFNAGTYVLSGLDGLDSGSQTGAPTLGSGRNYSVSSTGFGFLNDPLLGSPSISILVSKGILLGSATESQYNSIFIAAPITSLSVSSFSGAYTVNAFFPGSLDATYQLNPDGAGHLGSFGISGYTSGGQTVSQSASSIPYRFSNNAAVMTYPNTSANFYSGDVFMYFSPDANFVFGGSPNGYDIFVGVKNAGTGVSTPLSGLYYEAGIEQYGAMDTFYGTLNTAGDGNIVAHERIYYADYPPVGTTYHTVYPTPLTGTYLDASGTVRYTVGKNGFRIAYGGSVYLLMSVAMPYTPPAASGAVYLDPTGIVNTASSAPYTAGLAPGEFVTIYNGVNLANSTVVAPGVPYPTSLGGVKVLIDGTIAAPIYYVSPTQISFIVPYDISTFPFVSVQISNNGVLSNIATTNVNLTAPGVFTSDPVGGTGVAALLDFPAAGGYYVVDNDHPAHPGDNVAAYMTGLGTPFPANAAGAVGPLDGDILTQTISIRVGGEDVGTPGYAGLAPGLAGLYQINFTIPADTAAGVPVLEIDGPDSAALEAYIPVTLSGSAVQGARPVPAARSQGTRPAVSDLRR